MCVYSPTRARLSSVVWNAALHWNSGGNFTTIALSYIYTQVYIAD